MNTSRLFRGLLFALPLSLLLWCGILVTTLHEMPARERHFVSRKMHHLVHVLGHPMRDAERLFG